VTTSVPVCARAITRARCVSPGSPSACSPRVSRVTRRVLRCRHGCCTPGCVPGLPLGERRWCGALGTGRGHELGRAVRGEQLCDQEVTRRWHEQEPAAALTQGCTRVLMCIQGTRHAHICAGVPCMHAHVPRCTVHAHTCARGCGACT